MTRIDIRGIPRERVLAALFNGSFQQGMGGLDARGRAQLTEEDARAMLAEDTYFDYVRGRVLKVDLRDPESFDSRLYDRDCGEGAAARIIAQIREAQQP